MGFSPVTFAWPHFLWLLLVPVGLLTWELTRRRNGRTATAHPKILRAEIGNRELAQVRESSQADGRRVRPWLALGLAFAVVALARPQWGRIDQPVFDQSREILLAVDLSRSMLAQDVKPSRLDRAKLLIQALLEKLKGERVGLVVFSGTAFLQSPLSSDYEILREFLPSLSPDFLPEGGTNYGAMLDTSLDAFGGGSAADRFLIVLSDGEATDDNWQSHVAKLKQKGIRVIGLGVGTAGGSMIPDGSGGFVKDERGAVVLSKLESGTLEQLAQATGGVYRDASSWIDLASLIDQTVNAAKKGSFEDRNTILRVERFQWPLALAMWCFLVSLYYEFPVRPRTRAIALRGSKPAGGAKQQAAKIAAPLILILLAPLGVAPTSVRAAVKIAPVDATPGSPAAAAQPGTAAITTPSMLGKIVGRLSNQDRLTAPDLSELAHETVNWGRALKESGQPVPPGPVHDALAAVDQLQATGGQLADWQQLRQQLEALLQAPPKQKPPPQKQPSKQDQKNQGQNSKQQNQSGGQNQQDKNQQNQSQQKQNQSNASPQNQSSQNQPGGDKSRGQNQPSQPQKQPSNQSAFGDMTKQSSPPPPSQPANDTQTVGGIPDQKPTQNQSNPALAVPLQKLDQLKNQDSPAKLFELMEPDRSQAARTKPAMDW